MRHLVIICLFISQTGFLYAQTDLLRYVDPFIGTGGHGHTFPGPTAPFGMVQLSPDTRPSSSDWDGCSGYHYSDTVLYGFSHTHLSGTGVPDYADVLVLPYTGKPFLETRDNALSFQKKDEHAEAGYYSVFCRQANIKAELTAGERVGVHRYSFPPNMEQAHLMIDLRFRDDVLSARLEKISDTEIAGHRVSKSWAGEQHVYFVMRFSRPIFNARLLDMSRLPYLSQSSVSSIAVVGLLDFYNAADPLVVTVGLSGVSVEGARKNLEAECAHFDFDKIKRTTQQRWAEQLNKIQVKGGSEEQKKSFYTALYHTCLVPYRWNDVDGAYRGRDNQIHANPGHEVYTVFSLWDTYRAAHPLYTIIEPKRVGDFIQTFLRQYEQGKLLPVWELSANETNCMIGYHAVPVIADAWLKGIRNYDGAQALSAMEASAAANQFGLPDYRRFGYILSENESESVSKTLEYAFDDWCIAQMAKSLGQTEVYGRFLRRAQSYKNLYNPEAAFFCARNNASWHTPFDPFEVNFHYTEANAWQYRFAVPQDVSGLMQWMGGRDGFTKALDALFDAKPGTTGREQADMTGFIGQYVQGNEPSHHMAYLYNYAGQAWKTQRRVRQIMDELYSARPDGLSGNEDCGQMSAWLLMSAMGFYPVVPCGGEYAIGTPWFEEIRIQTGENRFFTISAPGVSSKNCYIQQAQLNGQAWPNSWVRHEEIMRGGTLTFLMGERASDWARAYENCPKSAITEQLIVPAPFVAKGARVFRNSQTLTLACLDPQASIYFTLDGTEPGPGALAYRSPLVITQKTMLKMVAVRGESRSAVINAEFSKMRDDLNIFRYNTRYTAPYTGRGDAGLIDQLRGGSDFRSGGWQGFHGVDMDVVIDLGQVKPLQRVVAGFLQDENAWIFFPSQVNAWVSDDGQNFRPVGVCENRVPFSEKGVLLQDFNIDFPTGTSGRYLRVVGKSLGVCPPGHKGNGGPGWVFADEVMVE